MTKLSFQMPMFAVLAIALIAIWALAGEPVISPEPVSDVASMPSPSPESDFRIAAEESVAEGVLPTGLVDKGIFSDLDDTLSIPLAPVTAGAGITLVVNKSARVLTVLVDSVAVKTYPIALGFEPIGDKAIRGDGRTPEGVYYIVEMQRDNLAPRYGARSLRLSYPNAQDARRGVNRGLISESTRRDIEGAIKGGRIPSQATRLGSSIRIHGGGVGHDWTHGCIAMRDQDVVELYDIVENGTVVRIDANAPEQYSDRDRDGIPNQVDVLLGALKADLNDAVYDGSYVTIPSTMGDVSRDRGCCTDVVIRALRNAGVDLQAAVQKDVRQRPDAYHWIPNANANIDHRRVKNLLVYMARHFKSLPADARPMPGDILFFDTLPKAGPDHIGVVGATANAKGELLVINNWTEGSVTDAMDLSGWVPITHHFRLP